MKKQAAFSLIELVIALVVLSLGAAAFINLINQTTLTSVDPLSRVQANAIARAYLEEISLKSFCDPDWDTDGNPTTLLNCPIDCMGSLCDAGDCRVVAEGSTQEGNRGSFDDICDYDGLNDNGAEDQNGNPIANLNNYIVDVTVTDAGLMLNGLNASTGQVVRIDVEVTHATNPDVDVTLTNYRTNF